jgi:hypothetical protein
MQIVTIVKVFVVLTCNGRNYVSIAESGGLLRDNTVAGYQADSTYHASGFIIFCSSSSLSLRVSQKC